MSMTWKRAILYVILGLFLGLYESTFATFATGMAAWVLPILPITVLYVVREKMDAALLISGSAGIVLDLIATGGVGFAYARFLLITLLVIFLARTILTNQSVYTALALMIVARVCDRLWLFVLSWSRGWMPLSDLVAASWRIGWRVGVADLCLIAVVFITIALVARRFVIDRGSASNRYVG